MTFHYGLVLRFPDTRRQHARVIMMCHLYQEGIYFSLVFIRRLYRALEVVRHQYLRNTAVVFQRMPEALCKALLGLAGAGFDISVFAVAQRCKEDFCILHLPGRTVYIRDLFPGIVNVEFVPGLVLYVHAHIHGLRTFAVEFAELGITVAVRIGKAILVP